MATIDRLPTGDGDLEGAYWTKGEGSTYFYEDVDDPIGSPDDGTSFVSCSSATDRYLLFTFAGFSVPAGAIISKLTISYRHYTPISAYCASGLKVNGTRYFVDAGVACSGSWTTTAYDYTTNPDTGSAWTVDDINGVGANALEQFGLYARTNGSQPQITQVYATVEYTTPQGSSGVGMGGCSAVSAAVAGSWTN